MQATVECPNCKQWYEGNPSNTCPFCGHKAAAYMHVNVSAGAIGKSYVNVIVDSLLHRKEVTVIERRTGSIVARLSQKQFNLEKDKYPSDQYIIV
jgi:hypothetical protein